MPDDSTPRSVTFERTNGLPAGSCWFFGTVAPTSPTGTFCPAATFGAPHTICSTSFPTFTRQTVRRSAFGCFCVSSTSPTTKPS